jgi:CheY-like chemotaxis protein/HPt (histidine-containing phosphotransfer) domain-containing protein
MLDNDNLELNCRVVDTGIGIPANKINSIFEKFSQVDSSNTRQFGGTGLGLAIVKQLVEIMNGSIGVESALGEGSTFWFKIPFLITNELGGENVPNHKNRTKVSLNTIDALDAKILVAEDHPLNQAFMKMLLPKYNLTNFDICENGHEILQSLKQKEYDLILMDCFMPELDGYETTKIIRENEKSSGKHIPIVALTANAMIGDSEKCIAAGMDDYIAKPIAEESLVEILSQWIALPDICSINFQSPKTSEQAPVDLTTLRTITNGDVAMDRKLLALFVTKSNENLAILSEKCIDGECQEWTESAHMLKGGAASIGAEALKILCNEAQNLDNATSNDRYALYENIRNEYSAVCEYLRKNNLIE